MAKKEKTLTAAQADYEAAKKAVKTMSKLIEDGDVIEALKEAEQRAKKELDAARKRDRRAKSKRAEDTAAAMKTWMGGEFLSVAGLAWTEVDPAAWSRVMAQAAAALAAEVARDAVDTDEARSELLTWQKAIRSGRANRATGEVEPEPEERPESREVDVDWRGGLEGGESYLETNVWSCPVCGNNAAELRPWKTMRPVADPPMCKSDRCAGKGVAMAPHPPKLGGGNAGKTGTIRDEAFAFSCHASEDGYDPARAGR